MPPAETTLLKTRPGVAFILLYRPGWWVWPALLLWAIGYAAAWAGWVWPGVTAAAVAWLVLGFVWRVLMWLSRSYVLTDRRVWVKAGVISRVFGDVPLTRIQHTTMTQSVAERLLGLGTIGVATAGNDGAAVHWLMVPRPQAALTAIRAAVERAMGTGTVEPKVIGLAGGIGSGKSEVAKLLASMGCVVLDSDQDARQALDRPEVRDELVRWWGRVVLGADGRINRSAVADIVFKQPSERAKLEGLVHPIVRTQRAEAKKRAGSARAVVIDAPLLFEAGVDAECDAVIFVEAPRELRLERVRGRGWDEAELARREASQLPVEEKRRRSGHVVRNLGSREELRAQVARILEEILASPGR